MTVIFQAFCCIVGSHYQGGVEKMIDAESFLHAKALDASRGSPFILNNFMFPSTNSVSFQHYYQSNCGNVLFRGWHPLSYFLQGGQTLYSGNKVHTHSHRSAANHLARDIVSLLMYHFLSFFKNSSNICTRPDRNR